MATIVGLISICNAVGRVLFGGMYDKYGRSLSMQLVNGLFILTSAVLLLAMSRGSVAVVILGFVLGGLAYSGVTPTNSAFCRAYRRQFGQPPSSAKQDAAETPKSRKKA